MGVQVISIPTEVVSHSLPFPFPILCFILVPMGFPWDSRSHWESHSHAHLYSECQPGALTRAEKRRCHRLRAACRLIAYVSVLHDVTINVSGKGIAPASL